MIIPPAQLTEISEILSSTLNKANLEAWHQTIDLTDGLHIFEFRIEPNTYKESRRYSLVVYDNKGTLYRTSFARWGQFYKEFSIRFVKHQEIKELGGQ